MQMKLKIPVKPHVRKYLNKKYGQHYKMNKRDAISITLYNMLRRPSSDTRLSSRTKKCTAEFEVNLSAFSFFKKGCRNLDAYTIIQFNSYVESCIDTEFFSYVENLESLGLQQKEAIAHFMLKYDLDETDIKYDTLKKSYQRYRNKQNESGNQKINGIAFVPMICVLKVLGSKESMRKIGKFAA